MENKRVFITLGKLAGDSMTNVDACLWQGQARRSVMDQFMTEPGLKISILNAKSQVIGYADDVKCVRSRSPNVPPLFTFRIVRRQPCTVNPVPLGLVKGERHRFRRELLHKYGYTVMAGNICDGVFLCTK
jgi:hypothetical protein